MTHEAITNRQVDPQLHILLSDPIYTAFVSKLVINAAHNIIMVIEMLNDAQRRLIEASAKFDQACKDVGK
jgi:hypothetical protein